MPPSRAFQLFIKAALGSSAGAPAFPSAHAASTSDLFITHGGPAGGAGAPRASVPVARSRLAGFVWNSFQLGVPFVVDAGDWTN